MSCKTCAVGIFTGSSITSFGGGERGAIELSNELVRRKVDVVIFTSNDNSRANIAFSEIKRICFTKILRFETLPTKLGPIFPLFRLNELREIARMTTIYNIDESLFTGLFLVILSKIKKIKYIYGMHTPDSFLFSNHSAQSIFKKKVWFIYRIPLRVLFKAFVSNVHVINNDQKKKLESLRFQGKIDLIPDFVYREPKEIVFNSREFQVLFTGALGIEIKGADLLARVIQATLEKEMGVKFCIAGPPGNGIGIINELAVRYPNNVSYKGFVSESELVILHQDASLFIFTSRVDSFSLGVVWAQSYGLPCVAFDIPGPRDILASDRQGSLIETFNTEKFSCEILKFYSLWLENQAEYLSLRLEIQEGIYERLGKNIIVPKMIDMFCMNETVNS